MPLSLSLKNAGGGTLSSFAQQQDAGQLLSPPTHKSNATDSLETTASADAKKANAFFQLSGLDLDSIDSGVIEVNVPLKGGLFGFPGPYADAQIRFRPNAVAQLNLGFGKENGKTIVNGAHLSLYPPIKIKNPAAAFEPTRGLLGRVMDVDYLKDKVASVVVSGARISKDGKIHLEGHLKVGPFVKKDLRLVMPAEKLPRVNLDFHALGKQGQSPQFDLAKLLSAVGAVANEARFTVKAHSEPRQIALNAFGIQAWTDKASADGKLSGRGRLTRENSVHLNIDQQNSALDLDAGHIQLGGEVRVGDLASGRPTLESHLAFRATPNRAHAHLVPLDGIDINVDLVPGENALSGHAFVFRDGDGKITLKDASSLSAQLSARVQGDQKIAGDSFDANLKDGVFRGKLAANVGFNEEGPHVSAGEAMATVGARDLDASYRGFKASVPGTFNARLNVPMWTMSAQSHYPNARGEVQVGLTPDAASFERVPELAPYDGQFAFDLKDNATLQVDPINNGVSAFLRPVTNLVLQPKARRLTPGVGCEAIGSHAFRKRCEEIGGAKIHHDNRVELLIDGKASLPQRLALIQGAQKSVCYQTMIFKDDSSGRQIADALCAAAKRGVTVRVIIDALGNIANPIDLMSENPIYQSLKEAGVQLQLNGDAMGEGVRKTLGALSQSPTIGEILNLNELADPKKMLSLLHLLAKAAKGESELKLDESARKQLEEGLLEILTGGQGKGQQDLVLLLEKITEDDVLELSEVVQLLKGMAHLNFRWHEKYLIADEHVAIVGGLNTSDEYLLGGTGKKVMMRGEERPAWRDTDLLLEGDAAKDTLRHFAANWKTLTDQVLPVTSNLAHKRPGDYKVQMVHSRPRIDGDSNIIDTMIECLGSLKSGQKAYMESAYFLPTGSTKRLEEALIQAAQRGVDVRILVNSEGTSDVVQVPQAAVFSWRRLLSNGVRVFERSGNRMMHSKVSVFGTQVAGIGSWNSDNRSTSLNSEAVAMVHSHRFAKKVEKMLNDDMAEGQAQEITLQNVGHLPLQTEFRNLLSSLLSDMM